MKRKTFKRIGAILLAMITVFAMSSMVWGAGDDGRTVDSKTNTYTGSNNTNATITGTSIPLTKSIVFINANGSAVYEPNITYTYNVQPAVITANTYTITDASGEIVKVKPGINAGVTGTTITFGPTVGSTATTPVTTSATGVSVERTGNLTFDPGVFTEPGVYRYVINETTAPASVQDAGLTARTANYVATRYLDVYVRRNATTPTTLEMYGAVIFKSVEGSGRDDITTSTAKCTGFEPAAETVSASDETVDRYTTYDIEVSKSVAGDLADRSQEFPFYVTLANTINGAKYTFIPDTGVGAGEDITSTSITKGSDATSSNISLKHGESIKFVGVPSNQTTNLSITVKEYNTSNDKYEASVTVTNGTAPTITGAVMAAGGGAASLAAFDVKANDIANQVMALTNTTAAISPTGVYLRYGAFLGILAAAIAILIVMVARRRRDRKEM